MPANSRAIGAAQEKGDLRENAEYKAAMEKQAQLQAEIQKVDAEVKRARAIDTSSVRNDVVSIGAKVSLNTSAGEPVDYSILGPWDADTENNIISYVAPLAMSLMGKKTGDTAELVACQ